MYTAVKDKWQSKIDDPANPALRNMPDNDCLAIARYVICAKKFPSCTDKDETETPICSWVCDLFKRRCKNEVDLYDELCMGPE